MATKNIVTNRVIFFFFLTLSCFTAKAQYTSVDSLKGFLCYKFGDTIIPKNAELRDNQHNGKYIIYHIDKFNFCEVLTGSLTLYYYEGKIYQICMDFDGEEDFSTLNILTKAFGKYDRIEVVPTDVEIRMHYWLGSKVEVKCGTDATSTGWKIVITDKVARDKIYNLPFRREGMNKREKDFFNKILEK